MLKLRYRFETSSFLQIALARSLAPWLAGHFDLKLESAGPLLSAPELYGFFSRPLLQSELCLHTGLAFQPDPACANLFWWSGGALPAHEWLLQIDELWSMTPGGAEELKKRYPEKPVHYLPPCLELSHWQTDAPLPAELELEPEQRLLLWQSPTSDGMEAVLKAFIPDALKAPDVVLLLQIDAVSDDFEDGLMEQIAALCEEHGIAEMEQLNIHTLIGPLAPEAWLGLLQRTAVLLNPAEPLLVLAARALGKTVLAPVGLLTTQTGVLLWEDDSEANRQVLRQALELTTSALSDLAAFSVELVGPELQERLNRLPALIDLPTRREKAKAERLNRAAAEREGRKQKYSLFHSDYQADEMQSRRAWHARYAEYFKAVRADVLDIGCGSGIFLEILKEMQIPAFGIDPDPDMVDVCQELGLQALAGDERVLADCVENSLGGIHASHIIEHIDGQRAIAMVENALAALAPGGLLLIRTPNWRNQMVRHEGFWLDITHIRPYPLPLLQQVLKDAGFEVTAAGFEEFGWNDTFIVGRKPLSGEKA
ncbi:hypothetical protein COW36_22980 [bacterium (Candidatus Blackallbacteria) CG17_big_fil_post_rev_8_21_14_2_50_48_46]|uniref:Methyltransferase type 11 domain-containing protein n=1 Tax=bacterium (Candidatus Blackallbacteria) CG17_big_fil_post_rev_8_21_14_2_50_48_46 TaxID=2014261 RepID=A0A2M7FYA1_9BACT|nr:MAG: hypothetical protein COW64_16050 [bacterium (Candidatus Blackallbacteria) CG18_big_fil_WC_8_21_14_2_50_49_26]PIW14115.1 MAG: hypothetical protein COW36_22980 [bacterium (Candidatus Blackallbacteria) CG17_big_fil_post_rev_8_21_14_2_50_48_46]PIW45845.1 MAG: hypothetical protein COW20_18645 [bacterium (Candidatus Blackallbacteria) CG13_big_fil_rev_8_21_14_2_50_49_14]